MVEIYTSEIIEIHKSEAPCSPRGLAGIRGGGWPAAAGNSPRGRCPQARHLHPGVRQELHVRVICTLVDEVPKAKRGVSYRPAMSHALFRGRVYTRRLESL